MQVRGCRCKGRGRQRSALLSSQGEGTNKFFYVSSTPPHLLLTLYMPFPLHRCRGEARSHISNARQGTPMYIAPAILPLSSPSPLLLATLATLYTDA